MLNEGLKIGKDWKYNKKYKPQSYFQLVDILNELLKKRGNNANLNDVDVSAIKDMSVLFAQVKCDGVYKIDISEWDVSNVEKFDSMFYETDFSELDLSKWDVSNAKSMSSMFLSSKYLTNVGNLDNWDISNVKNMKFMFGYCKNLKNIGDISKWNVENINTDYMFAGCEKLKTIGDVTNWKIHKDILLCNMFSNTDIKPMPIKRVR